MISERGLKFAYLRLFFNFKKYYGFKKTTISSKVHKQFCRSLFLFTNRWLKPGKIDCKTYTVQFLKR